MGKFKTYRQYDQIDCGPTCLRMVARHHGRNYTMETLRQKSGINREGVSLLGISEAAEDIGLRTVGAKLSWECTLPRGHVVLIEKQISSLLSVPKYIRVNGALECVIFDL